MYKDFKKSESLDTGFVGGSGIIWMFSGILIGLLVGLGMYYFSNIGHDTNDQQGFQNPEQNTIKKEQFNEPLPQTKVPVQPESQQPENNSAAGNADQVEPKKSKNKFSYQAILPTVNVPVSSKAIDTSNIIRQQKRQKEAASRNNKAKNKAPAAQKGNYLVRIASFRKKKMAKHALNMLKKREVDAKLQKVKIKGRVWYRINAGPVDKASADLWKTKARKLGHKPIIQLMK